MKGYFIAGALLVGILVAVAAYWRGYEQGQLAAHNSFITQQQKDTVDVIHNRKKAQTDNNQKAIDMRKKLAALKVKHEAQNQRLQRTIHKLRKTHQCLAARLPNGLLRQLNAARDRAAHAASTGTLNAAMPATHTRAARSKHHDE